MTKADSLTGVKCFSISGRMLKARERCLGMTDEERRWRAQWLKDQVLSPDEPKYVPEYYKDTNNILRRLWKAPMNKFQTLLEPLLGKTGAYFMRHSVKTILYGMSIAYIGTYFLKYNANDFTRCRSIDFYKTRERMYPDHPDYPNYPVAKTPSDYYDEGFYSSVLCQDAVPEEEIPPPPPPPPPPPEPDFTTCRSIDFYRTRERMYPDHPDYPNYPVAKTPSDYYDEGFYSSILAKKV